MRDELQNGYTPRGNVLAMCQATTQCLWGCKARKFRHNAQQPKCVCCVRAHKGMSQPLNNAHMGGRPLQPSSLVIVCSSFNSSVGGRIPVQNLRRSSMH